MGIVNLTPDSFYDGSKLYSKYTILKHVENLLKEGAEIIDIGGCSTKPGIRWVKEEEEIIRVISPIRMIKKHFPNIQISLDTFRSEVAKQGINEGVTMINDISGGQYNTNMYAWLGKYQIPYVLNYYHIREKKRKKKENIIIKIHRFFSEKIVFLKRHGINDILIDPGFGFGKTLKQNFQLLKHLSLLNLYNNHVILIGISRKSMIHQLLNISCKNALNGTSILHTIAIFKNAKLFRVHDVKEIKECIKLVSYYRSIS
ncbi:dihydropteroate synthase [Blattabacterium cuenoti]|uniref:dihydropteroate synthase n=1 Tax=Blattabacterium cuenoti TaxID=1653831 RepID=UPI00163BFFFA|nr:dihydropteroate synthase [Blattabacterium cuenoti]